MRILDVLIEGRANQNHTILFAVQALLSARFTGRELLVSVYSYEKFAPFSSFDRGRELWQ